MGDFLEPMTQHDPTRITETVHHGAGIPGIPSSIPVRGLKEFCLQKPGSITSRHTKAYEGSREPRLDDQYQKYIDELYDCIIILRISHT